MLNILLIGVGKIGNVFIEEILTNHKYDPIKISVFIPSFQKQNSQYAKLRGHIKDLKPTGRLPANFKERLTISDDMNSMLLTADMLLITAAGWPSIEQKEKFKTKDDTGRLVQYLVNKTVVSDLAKKIDKKKLKPETNIFIITNPVDLIAEELRTLLPLYKHRIFGVSTIVDESRFIYKLSQELKKIKMYGFEKNSSIFRITASIVGSHTLDMVLLQQTIHIDSKPIEVNEITLDCIQKAFGKTLIFGKTISDLQRDSRYPNKDSGAALSPGYKLAEIAGSLLYPFTGSLNAHLSEDIAQWFGLSSSTSLSVTTTLSPTGISFVKPKISTMELAAIKIAHTNLEKNKQVLKSYQEDCRAVTIMSAYHSRIGKNSLFFKHNIPEKITRNVIELAQDENDLNKGLLL